REEGLTIRQIYQRFAAARGQRTLIGSPSDIADNIEEWFRGYAVDGFLYHPSHFAGWTRRFRRARDPRTTVARSVSGRVRRHDAAGEYGARTAEEWLTPVSPRRPELSNHGISSRGPIAGLFSRHADKP